MPWLQVILWEGEGRVMVNRRPLDSYFADVADRAKLLRPLLATAAAGRFNVLVLVSSCGVCGARAERRG